MTIITIKSKQERFLAASQFAVVGSSAAEVLSWYREKHMDVIPVHPKAKRLEGINAVPSISNLPSPSTTALSIATMPFITLTLLKQARALSIHSIWLQPGAYDSSVIQYIEDNNLSERVIWGGPCILREGDAIVQKRWFEEIHGF